MNLTDFFLNLQASQESSVQVCSGINFVTTSEDYSLVGMCFIAMGNLSGRVFCEATKVLLLNCSSNVKALGVFQRLHGSSWRFVLYHLHLSLLVIPAEASPLPWTHVSMLSEHFHAPSFWGDAVSGSFEHLVERRVLVLLQSTPPDTSSTLSICIWNPSLGWLSAFIGFQTAAINIAHYLLLLRHKLKFVCATDPPFLLLLTRRRVYISDQAI